MRVTKINFCSVLIFVLLKCAHRMQKLIAPFVSSAGNILEPKRKITDLWLNQQS